MKIRHPMTLRHPVCLWSHRQIFSRFDHFLKILPVRLTFEDSYLRCTLPLQLRLCYLSHPRPQCTKCASRLSTQRLRILKRRLAPIYNDCRALFCEILPASRGVLVSLASSPSGEPSAARSALGDGLLRGSLGLRACA